MRQSTEERFRSLDAWCTRQYDYYQRVVNGARLVRRRYSALNVGADALARQESCERYRVPQERLHTRS